MALTEAEREVLRASEDPRKTSGERLAAVRRLTGTASVRGGPGFEELMKRSTGRNRHSKRAT